MANSEIEGALELLSHAQIDAEVCVAIAERETLVSATAFHAQQAVEKALKAVLAANAIEFPLTHNLIILLDQLSGIGLVPPVPRNDIIALNPYAVEGRYSRLPQGVNVPKILKTTRDCFEWASAQINK